MLRFGRQIAIHAVLLGAAVLSVPACALSPTDEQEVQSFKLSEDFLHRYEAVAKQASGAEKVSLNPTAAALKSLDALTGEITKSSPNAVTLVRQHGLTVREALVGSIVLMRAGMADSMLANPQMAKYVDKAKMPSAANMAFYRAHKEEIGQAMKGGEKE